MGEQQHALGLRLGYEHAVERVFVERIRLGAAQGLQRVHVGGLWVR